MTNPSEPNGEVPADAETEVGAEVIHDLDAMESDADDVRGGNCFLVLQGIPTRLQ